MDDTGSSSIEATLSFRVKQQSRRTTKAQSLWTSHHPMREVVDHACLSQYNVLDTCRTWSCNSMIYWTLMLLCIVINEMQRHRRVEHLLVQQAKFFVIDTCSRKLVGQKIKLSQRTSNPKWARKIRRGIWGEIWTILERALRLVTTQRNTAQHNTHHTPHHHTTIQHTTRPHNLAALHSHSLSQSHPQVQSQSRSATATAAPLRLRLPREGSYLLVEVYNEDGRELSHCVRTFDHDSVRLDRD